MFVKISDLEITTRVMLVKWKLNEKSTISEKFKSTNRSETVSRGMKHTRDRVDSPTVETAESLFSGYSFRGQSDSSSSDNLLNALKCSLGVQFYLDSSARSDCILQEVAVAKLPYAPEQEREPERRRGEKRRWCGWIQRATALERRVRRRDEIDRRWRRGETRSRGGAHQPRRWNREVAISRVCSGCRAAGTRRCCSNHGSGARNHRRRKWRRLCCTSETARSTRRRRSWDNQPAN